MSRVIGLFVICLLLTGCISMRAPRAPENYQVQTHEQRRVELNDITHWYIRGAMSIRQTNRSDIVQITWQQNGNNYRINISGPLSVGAARLIGRPGHVVLEKSQQEKFTAKNPESLLQQQLGWRLPVSNLFYWVRGLPNPKLTAKTQYDQYGHLITLTQSNWQVHYQRFLRVKNIDLPSIMSLTNPKLKVKLVIKRWQIQT